MAPGRRGLCALFGTAHNGLASACALCRLWLTLDERLEAPRLRWPRRWGDGILDATEMERLLQRATEEYRPTLGLGVTVCEGWRLRNRVYWDGEVGVEHLLASCAVPGISPAQRLGGAFPSTGGLRRLRSGGRRRL
ncbi:MAG: hypothetical protein INH40_08700 [Acidobacteriaceae bacterium]|nr:hypothetical protein [Acidobacteriaceae bacterium]